MHLPCGTYHEHYAQDHAWWQTRFVWLRMLLLIGGLLIFPQVINPYLVASANLLGYTILGAMGVQLLIGFAGQVTLGHAAFIAVGAYASAISMLQFGLPYPVSIVVAAIIAGVWSVIFGLPSARVKGFYLIMTSMAAQFITVEFIITQYVSQIGGRGVAFSIPPGSLNIGPWPLRTDTEVYYLMLVLVIGALFFMANLMRTRVGRAWIAIRDNDIAAEVIGVNVFKYKLMAYFVAGALGGVAGAFWISNLSALSPESFPWSWSLWLVGAILIGGVGSNYGTVFGSMFMVLIMEGLKAIVIPLSPVFPALLAGISYLRDSAFGLAIVVFLLYEPNGLSYRWWQIKNYIHLWPFSR